MVSTNKAGAFQCLGDKYVMQKLDGLKRGDASLSLLITKEKELTKNVYSIGCCDHNKIEFNILRTAKGRSKTLGFKRISSGFTRT